MSLAKVVRRRLELPKNPRMVTGPLEDWLGDHGWNLGIEDEDDLALARRLLEASKRNNVRHGRFGASSRGMCARRQIYAYLGLPAGKFIDPILQNIFNDGTFRHIRWQLMLMKAGIATDVEVPVKVPDWRVSVSLDAENDEHPWFLELKGWGQGKYTGNLKTVEDIPPEHMLQMHTCMFATGWDTAIYIAEQKGTNDWQEIVVKRDKKVMDHVKFELDYLNECVEAEEVPPILPDCKRRRGEAYKECPYAAFCVEHHAEGSPWPDDFGHWPGEVGTSVSLGQPRRSARVARRT